MFSPLRRAFRDFSIQRKLTLIITGTSALSLLLACAGFAVYEVVTFREVALQHTETRATLIGYSTAAPLTFNYASDATEALAALRTEADILGAAVYTRDGRLFASYVREGGGARLPLIAPPPDGARFTAGRLELSRNVIKDGEVLGTLHMITDLRALDDRLRRYFAIAGALLFAATLAAFGLSSAFQRVVSQPLSELVALARRISLQKDYSVRAPERSRDEIGQLIAGFNDMLAQIQQRDAALRGAHDDLERRVHERTHQLEQQIAERRAAERALQQQLTRISLLNQIAAALSDRQDLDRIVQTVLAELEKHLPVDFGSVSLFDPAAETLVVAASRRRQPASGTSGFADVLAPSGPFNAALGGLEACRGGELIYLPDTTRQPHALAQRFARAALRSVVAVPLFVEHRLFGVLIVARGAAEAFTSGESEFLRMLGEQVAVAGSQARLYTELQRAYTELRESQRAIMQQERLRALGQMASGIAHDINNSLTPIVTFSDLLLTSNFPLPEKARTFISHIQTAGVDIGTIVSRLREFYRPRDDGEAQLPVDLHSVLRQVAELTRPRWRDMPQARGAVIVLRTDFAAELDLIAGNETELRESFTNLVLNAVDAMPQGGTLTFRTRRQPAGEGHPARAIVEIVDTGVGMNEETRSRCLEPFFSTKGQLGTGLGLAMVYGVLERHGGNIEIESHPGEGTTMRLIFPARPQGDLPEEPGAAPDGMRSRRILCVDDEPMLQQVLKELFRLDGHDVIVVGSGAAGLAALREASARGARFDIVVTDLGMPHMDGQQFAQAVKREAPGTPVILLTGWGKIMKQDGDMPGAIDIVLSKPPRLKELRAAIAELAGSSP